MTTKPQSTTEETLHPCPWCPVKTELSLYHLPDSASRHVYCRRCNGAGPWGDSDAEAINVWNTRISPASAAPVVDKRLFDELLTAFDSTRMGEKGINQGCWCVQSPTDTNQPGWKHNKECKANMALLKRCEAAAATAAPQTKSCGFCGKSDQEVKMLIQAPVGYICDECVAVCASIIERNRTAAPMEQSSIDNVIVAVDALRNQWEQERKRRVELYQDLDLYYDGLVKAGELILEYLNRIRAQSVAKLELPSPEYWNRLERD